MTSAYETAVLADSPTAYWTWAGGSLSDLSGHGNTLTVAGSPTVTTDGPVAGEPTAVGTNNGAGYLCASPGTLATDGTRQLSVECWVKGAAFSDQVLLYQDGYYSARSWHVTGQGGPARGNCNGTSDPWPVSATAAFDGTWHHLVVTFDAGADETRFYIDGALDVVRTDPFTGAAANTADLHIGFGFVGASAPTAQLAHLALYFNAVLPADRVAAHYTASSATPAPPELGTGHLALDGGALSAPGHPVLATGHLSLAGPVDPFGPSTTYPDVNFHDDFNRDDINPAPNGYQYLHPELWAIADGELTAAATRSTLLIWAGAGSDKVTVTVARVDDNISIFERAQAAGIVLGYQGPDSYVWVLMTTSLGQTTISVIERYLGADTGLGGWDIAGHVGTLSAHIEGGGVTVSWQGEVLGNKIFAHPHSGAVGLYGQHDATGSIQAPQFDQLDITFPYNAPAVPMHLELRGGRLGSIADNTVALGGAIRGSVVYGPRISQPGTYTPPIVARVYRLRDWRHPIVTLDQSFARTWQEQMGEAGSGSVTLLNDDPDLALVRDGDIIRFELYGEAAFSCVVTGRDKATIAPGEEHDEVTVLTGPGLLAWLTDSMLIYPARQPPPEIHGPAFDRPIQGTPIEEDRIFSWASYAQLVDNDLYGPTVDLGPMPEPLPTDNGWPDGVVAQRIWVPAGAAVGQVYYRMGFTCADPTVEIYIHAPLMDPIKVWLDGSLVADSPGGLDYGDVQVVGGDTSTLGTDQHVLCVWIDHRGGDAWLAAVGLGVDDEGEYTGQVMGTGTDWTAVAYPPSPPPVTAGAVIEAVLGEMNSRRYNPQMGVGFTIETDSDGNAWPPLPEITTKVGSSVWTFLQELSDHVEVYMAHDPNVLYGWVIGGRGSERDVTLHGPTDPHDPDTSNLRGLTHKRAT